MLNKLKSLIKNHQANIRQEESFRKHSFKDPLALNISWDLLYHPTLSATNVRLKFNKRGQIKFAFPWEDQIFGAIWLVLGVLMISATFIPSLNLFMDDPLNAVWHGIGKMTQQWKNEILFSWLVGAGSIWLGIYVIKNSKVTQRFLQDSQQYIIGSSVYEYHEIHAVQFVRDLNRANKLIYQINLILHNGKRIPVIRSRRSLGWQRQSKKLAKYIGVPYWTIDD